MLDFAHQDLPILLIIDDDMVSREVMATMLTMSGYLAHTAADGEAALGLLATGECVPGVILMDAQMPGLSGIPLIEQLRARSQAQLYVVSASDAPDTAAAPMTSLTASTLEPGSMRPKLRTWVNTGTPRSAASRNMRMTSRRLAPGVY